MLNVTTTVTTFETVNKEDVKAERLNRNQERQLNSRFFKSDGEK